MTRGRRAGVVGSVAVVLSAIAALPAHGQSDLGALFAPRVRVPVFRLDAGWTGGGAAEVRGQGGELTTSDRNGQLTLPIAGGPDYEWGATVKWQQRANDSRAVLPGSGVPLPGTLTEFAVGAVHRRFLSGGRIAGGSLSLGSSSDSPFASVREDELKLLGFYIVPARRRDAWLFSVSYSNTREFLRNVPLPGVAYAWRPSERLWAMFGVPLFVEWKPAAAWNVQALWVPIRTYSVRATAAVARPVKAFASVDSSYQGYLRAGRERRDDRLFYYEKKAQLGVRVQIGRSVACELAGGRSFDRTFFEGENWRDDTASRIDLADTPFAAVRLNLRLSP